MEHGTKTFTIPYLLTNLPSFNGWYLIASTNPFQSIAGICYLWSCCVKWFVTMKLVIVCLSTKLPSLSFLSLQKNDIWETSSTMHFLSLEFLLSLYFIILLLSGFILVVAFAITSSLIQLGVMAKWTLVYPLHYILKLIWFGFIVSNSNFR